MSIEPTSERMIEEYRGASPQSYLVYLFHVVTYDYVRELVSGKEVLDFGCGTGYGTARLAKHCSRIVGIDISADAISYAQRSFKDSNLQYLAIKPVESQRLPFPQSSFDVVLSFQVIEHVRDENAYLAEIKRVLRPGGLFVVATPDRSSRLFPLQKPWNMWHLREYSEETFKTLLETQFSTVTIKKMGGKPDVITIETNRTRLLRWIFLPVTFPFVPEAIRVSALRFVQRVGQRLAPGVARQLTQTRPDTPQPAGFSFGAGDLSISDHELPSVNLIALAYP